MINILLGLGGLSLFATFGLVSLIIGLVILSIVFLIGCAAYLSNQLNVWDWGWDWDV